MPVRAGDLYRYLEDVKDKPFRWGSHDCFTFAIDVLDVAWGLDYSHFKGDYADARGALLHYARFRGEQGKGTFIEIANFLLDEVEHPRDGDLCGKDNAWTGARMGAYAYGSFVSVGRDGLAYEPLGSGDYVWRPRNG